jgi:hypothetical protein
MLTEYLRKRIYGIMVMKIPVVMLLAAMVAVVGANAPLPRKVVLNADNLEILRLDIMAMEVRVSNNVKEQSDRVVAALDRHGAKLDESWVDLRRSNIAMAAALDHQAARMDVIEDTINRLINATLFQTDVRPLISGFEKVVKSARMEARAAADGAKEAVVVANATREDVKEAMAAAPSAKSEPLPGWTDLEYWWGWWKASWHTPLSIFFLGFGFYQAESRAHTVLFTVLGFGFNPYVASVALFVVLMRRVSECCRRGKRWVRLTPCGRYLCPLSAAEEEREAELRDLGPARPAGARVISTIAHSTMNESALDTTTAPVGFWAYARGWMNPFFQYSHIGARNSFVVWYV